MLRNVRSRYDYDGIDSAGNGPEVVIAGGLGTEGKFAGTVDGLKPCLGAS